MPCRLSFVLLFLLTICLPAAAQDYRVVQPQRKALFSIQNFTPNRIQYDYCISIDSSNTLGTDTLHYNYRIAKPDTQAGCSYTFGDPSWLSDYYIERPGNEFIFFNALQDSIFFQGNNLGTWKMMDLTGGNAVYASYAGTNYENLAGFGFDSTRTFTLQVLDSGMLPVTHYLNGRVWKVAKTLGLAQGMSFWDFPDTLPNNLATLTRFDPGLILEEQIWDFALGDVMHIFEQKMDIQSDSRYYEEWVLVSKTVTPPLTTLIFQIRYYTYWNDYYNPPNYTYYPYSYRTVNVTEGEFNIQEDQLPYACYDTLTAQLADPDGIPAFMKDNQFGGRIQKHFYTPLFIGVVAFDSASNCFPIPDTTLASFNIMHNFWIEGLGGRYWEQDAINGDLHHFVRKPVWFRKGGQEWGTKLDFSGYVGLTDEASHDLEIYPHPMQESARITLQQPVPGSQLTIHNLNGRMVFTASMPMDGQLTLTRNEVPRAGIYLVSLKTPTGAVTHRKLVVQ